MTGEELTKRLDADSKAVEILLHTVLEARPMPQPLRDSMAYSLFAGGKRLRPALCLESCRMLSGAYEPALYAACALEMIHTYSLIHDDLPAMDNDDMRRGKPSNHIAFGEANAILAGDGLLSLACEILARHCGKEAGGIVTEGAFDMVSGQSLDLAGCSTEEELYRIHRLKTGALIKASVLAGAACAGASKADRETLERFSEAFGLLFQITDDILDYTGDAKELGKSTGKDEREGKLTFVTLYGVDGAMAAAKREAENAVSALTGYGERAAFFVALTESTLGRSA